MLWLQPVCMLTACVWKMPVCDRPKALGWTAGQGLNKSSESEMGKTLEGKLRLLNTVSLAKISALEI